MRRAPPDIDPHDRSARRQEAYLDMHPAILTLAVANLGVWAQTLAELAQRAH